MTSERGDEPVVGRPASSGARIGAGVEHAEAGFIEPSDMTAPVGSEPVEAAHPATAERRDDATAASAGGEAGQPDGWRGDADGSGGDRPREADVEPEPAAAADLFGDHIEMARSFTAELAARGEELGLIGPLEPPRIWTRHILNCALVAPLLRPGVVGDVGSGAGLPGLVLAIARPDVEFVLIEPMERRVEWLGSEITRLGLANATVVRARAEEARLGRPLDQVTARAVSALGKLIPITAPLVRDGGELVFMKGARVEEELAKAAKAVKAARLRDPQILVLGEGIVPEATRVFRATVGL